MAPSCCCHRWCRSGSMFAAGRPSIAPVVFTFRRRHRSARRSTVRLVSRVVSPTAPVQRHRTGVRIHRQRIRPPSTVALKLIAPVGGVVVARPLSILHRWRPASTAPAEGDGSRRQLSCCSVQGDRAGAAGHRRPRRVVLTALQRHRRRRSPSGSFSPVVAPPTASLTVLHIAARRRRASATASPQSPH